MIRWPQSTYSAMLILLMGAMAVLAASAGADADGTVSSLTADPVAALVRVALGL